MSMKDATTSLAFEVVKTACSNCNLRELCLPIGLDADEAEFFYASCQHICGRGHSEQYLFGGGIMVPDQQLVIDC